VRAPAPPLPTIAIEMLGDAAMGSFLPVFPAFRLQSVFKY
jgi:hypothetical protein